MPKVPATTYAGPGVITGPNGELLEPGAPIPKTWPLDVRQSLFDAGATVKDRPAITAALDALPGQPVSPGPGPAERVGPDAGEVATAHRRDRNQQ